MKARYKCCESEDQCEYHLECGGERLCIFNDFCEDEQWKYYEETDTNAVQLLPAEKK